MIRRFAMWLGRKYGMVTREQYDAIAGLHDCALDLLEHQRVITSELEEKLRNASKPVTVFVPKEVVKEVPVVIPKLDVGEALRKCRAGELPPRFEITAPQEAKFLDANGAGVAAKFKRAINELKREMGWLGWHVRIYSRTENCWLFRNTGCREGISEKDRPDTWRTEGKMTQQLDGDSQACLPE